VLTLMLLALAGQLVLLYHWSMLNYAALVKILKKHGAWAGGDAIRSPHAHSPPLSPS